MASEEEETERWHAKCKEVWRRKSSEGGFRSVIQFFESVADGTSEEKSLTTPLGKKLIRSLLTSLNNTFRNSRAWEIILVTLPANQLLSHKLVCKQWHSIISSPLFASAHLRHRRRRRRLLIHELKPPYNLNPSAHFRPFLFCTSPDAAVVGSVDGLICAVENLRRRIWIFNPVTARVIKLPPTSSSPSDAFSFVFWRDSTSDEYKLAKIVSNEKTSAWIWASGSPEAWTEIPVGFDGSFRNPTSKVRSCDVVIGDDFAYWIVFKQKVEGLFVMVLDLKTLSLSINEIQFPLHFMSPKALFEKLESKFNPDNSYLFAANWKGKFALVEKDVEKRAYDVWTFDEFGGVWRMSTSFAGEFRVKRCMNCINGKSIIFRGCGSDNIGCSVFALNVETGQGELIDCERSSPFATSVHDFVGSFVSIKGFKPPGAYGSKQLPKIRMFWPDE